MSDDPAGDVCDQLDQPDRRDRRPGIGTERRGVRVLRSGVLPPRSSAVRDAVVRDAGSAGTIFLLQRVRQFEEAYEDIHGRHGRADGGLDPGRAVHPSVPDGRFGVRSEHGGGGVRAAADSVLRRGAGVLAPPEGTPESVHAGQVPHPPQASGAGAEPASGDDVDHRDGAPSDRCQLLGQRLDGHHPAVPPRPRLLDCR